MRATAETTSSGGAPRMGVYAKADKTLDIETRFERAESARDEIKGKGKIGAWQS